MLAKGVTGPEHATQETPQQQMESHPVIRTLYDHTAVRKFFHQFDYSVFYYSRISVFNEKKNNY